MKQFFFLFLVIISHNIAVAQTATESHNNGQVALKKENYLGAIEYFTDAIAKEPLTSTNPVATQSYIGRGKAKAFLSDYKGAVRDFTKVINTTRVRDYKAIAYYFRGLVVSESGGELFACGDFEKAYKLGKQEAAKYICY